MRRASVAFRRLPRAVRECGGKHVARRTPMSHAEKRMVAGGSRRNAIIMGYVCAVSAGALAMKTYHTMYPAATDRLAEELASETGLAKEDLTMWADKFIAAAGDAANTLNASASDDGSARAAGDGLHLPDAAVRKLLGDTDQAEYIMRLLDTNRDGVISLKEFMSGMALLSKGNASQRQSMFFDAFDIDRDGGLSAQELSIALGLLVRMRRPELVKRPDLVKLLVDAEVAVITGLADSDGDQVVSRDEFMRIPLAYFEPVSRSLRKVEHSISRA